MKKFLKECLKPIIFLVSFLAITFSCMGVADGIQKDWGKVNVTMGEFEVTEEQSAYLSEITDNIANYETTNTTITYKLYTPVSATKDNKAPAVLLLHGYQNDHETCAAYAIELARRGTVVLAIDEYGHGKTDSGIYNRGYVAQKVSVNYGDRTDVVIQQKNVTPGAERFLVMMNFSNLSFFMDKFTKDEDGRTLKDSSMGGIAAYAYLSTLEYVDNTKMGISGHSMGTWASWTVAAAYSGTAIEPKATILQCGELFYKSAYDSDKIKFNNVMLLQAKWDEFNYFRDYNNIVDEDTLLDSELRREFLGEDGQNVEHYQWSTTYGKFENGSARRIELLYTNHRLTTHDTNGMKAALEWFNKSIGTDLSIIDSSNQVFLVKEWLVLLATLSAIASMFALMGILLKVPFFAKDIQALPNRPTKSGWKWWKGALITVGISAATYPFMCQLGHGLLPLPETSLFRMTIGNGFLAWYLLLIAIMLATTIIPWKKAKKAGQPLDFVDLGLAKEERANKFDWKLAGKMAILVAIMVGYMYLQCIICEAAFMLDFRFIWPFFKGFTWTRFFQLLMYLPVFVVFFVLNNSKIFAQMRNKDMNTPGFKGFIKCWWKNALCMAGGIFLLALIEYIPFFSEIGPGADLLFGSTFGGPFMSLLIVFFPQVLIFSVICTYCYRKTGNVYVGAYTVALLACWIVTGGSAML